MPSEDTTEVCPDCRSTSFENRVVHGHVPTDSTAQYRCNDCGTRFDKPDIRPAQNHGIPGAGSQLGGTLAAMDPGDLQGGAD